ncbi:glycosyltransferase family 2 protein [Rubrobacter taiwanensis]|uniref:glycosyltransferase family 2 protein n=1 Tax=Rubrobacter taiwanensis TaxID=185139 RepID=UPI001FB3D278|nr:glycosyltransferase family 2 protein [Rubrobacter taiwanensis]
MVAILATYNEERFIRNCIEHLTGQGVDVYLIDNCSTDGTVEIAREYLGRGLIGLETFPRNHGLYRWQAILNRKDELSRTLDGDWFMHVDADEVHLPPRPEQTLAEAFAEVEGAGCNAVDFQEFVFVPTRESPDHDRPDYQETMRWYYPFGSFQEPRLMRAWRRQRGPVGLGQHGGHRLSFPGMKLYSEKFKMKHYLFLSPQHLLDKYGRRSFERTELERGWHGWRARLEAERILLPSQSELRTYTSDSELDPSDPRERHISADWAAS